VFYGTIMARRPNLSPRRSSAWDDEERMDAAAMVDVDIVHRRKRGFPVSPFHVYVRASCSLASRRWWTPSSAEATSRSPWHSTSEQSVWSMDAWLYPGNGVTLAVLDRGGQESGQGAVAGPTNVGRPVLILALIRSWRWRVVLTNMVH
jgi:hypothetical protein